VWSSTVSIFGAVPAMNDWYEAEQRVERAQQLSESQRWAEALAEIDAALAINPHNASWHAQRGCLLEELDRLEEAVDAYATSIDLDSEDRDISMALGVALARLGQFTRALAVFDDVARAFPDFEPAYCHRIAVYAELGLHDQAEQMFYLAQELSEGCPHCFFHIGGSLAARGDAGRAIYCWRRVLELDPNSIGVNRQIAQAYRAKGDLDEARMYFLSEVRNDPGNTDLLYELAELTLESGQVATAAAKFSHILELEPDHPEARFALGRIWLRRGQPERALECFEVIRSQGDLDADLPGFSLKFGEALYRLGRFEEAHEHLQRAVEEDPANPTVQMLQGNCLLAARRLKPAANCFRRVLAVDGNNAFAYHNLGVCLLQLGSHEAGLEHCLKAIQAKPDYGMAMYNAVIAYLHLARWREARALLHRAIRNEPANEALHKLARRVWRHRLRHYLRKLDGLWRRISGRPAR